MAAVLAFTLGVGGYLARPPLSAGAGTAYQEADRNAEPAMILRTANVVPPGVTAEDVLESQARAQEFYEYDQGAPLSVCAGRGRPRAARSGRR